MDDNALTGKYKLLGPNGFYTSAIPGTLGGYRPGKIYGGFDCPSALRALAQGDYRASQVFFADEDAAIAAGFRPCGNCMKRLYVRWKAGGVPGSAEYPWKIVPKGLEPWPKKTRAVFDYLKNCAHNMRTVHYGEVAKATGLTPAGLGYQLGYIRDDICRKRGLPWLNAIVVNKQTWRTGELYLPTEVSINEQDQERMWRGMVLQVFAHDWAKVEFVETR